MSPIGELISCINTFTDSVKMSHRRWTLPEYSAMFQEIYETRNLALTNEQTLHRLIEEIAETVKPVLVYNIKAVKWCLPDVVAWTCAFANKCHIELPEIMNKYVESPPGKPKEQMRIRPFDIIGTEAPETFEDWQRYLAVVYRDENENIPAELMISKMIEDVGMTSRELRTRSDILEVKKHLAGVLAWTIALANKFQIKLDDAIYGKYPNYCFRCRNKPCKCFKLSTIFISYATDTENEMLSISEMVGSLGLNVETFQKLGPALARMRMVEAFKAIERSNGAIVLLKNHWSENVWAELIEVLKTIEANNVWICAKRSSSGIDKKLRLMLEDIKHFHKIQYYSDAKQLVRQLKHALSERVQELQKLEVKLATKK